MTNDKECYKTLHHKLSKYLKDKKNENVGQYINTVKTLLFFTGKLILLSFYKKNRMIGKAAYYKAIKDQNNEFLKKFKLIDYGNPTNLINDDIKEEIIKIVEEIPVDKLKDFSIGKLYESFITSRERKYLGQVYTPHYIVKRMINMGISEEDIIKNPKFKVIDPACGGGYFLLEAYNTIKAIITKNYNVIISKHPELKCELEKGIHRFILKNNIWGVDIDKFAVFMSSLSLLLKDKGELEILPNIYEEDILLGELKQIDKSIEGTEIKFNLVIGNPPYIGHKKIGKEYRSFLVQRYDDIYSDKADLSYCFFRRGYELLKESGKLILITSRYFQEALYAKDLRSFIKTKMTIDTIVDFYGAKVFKGIGISPTIIKCIKRKSEKNSIHIYRLKENDSYKQISLSNEDKHVFDTFKMSQSILEDDGWILVNDEERKVFKKIEQQGQYLLEQICSCNQGIITGCDKAFIVDKETIAKKNLETDVIKPWIKNSDIYSYSIRETDKFIIYTDLIKDISQYPNIVNHITPYEDKLNKRRECLKGIRKWYELQWGRNLNVFEVPKIVFPFKSKRNKFAIDYNNTLGSADVYIINIKDEYKEELSLEYLVAFLNSSIFEYYFKTVAKKLGEDLYEYYPNKIMKLKVKVDKKDDWILNKRVEKLIKYYKKLEQCNNDSKILVQINNELKLIDEYFFELYGLNNKEINIILSRVKKIW